MGHTDLYIAVLNVISCVLSHAHLNGGAIAGTVKARVSILYARKQLDVDTRCTVHSALLVRPYQCPVPVVAADLYPRIYVSVFVARADFEPLLVLCQDVRVVQ